MFSTLSKPSLEIVLFFALVLVIRIMYFPTMVLVPAPTVLRSDPKQNNMQQQQAPKLQRGGWGNQAEDLSSLCTPHFHESGSSPSPSTPQVFQESLERRGLSVVLSCSTHRTECIKSQLMLQVRRAGLLPPRESSQGQPKSSLSHTQWLTQGSLLLGEVASVFK